MHRPTESGWLRTGTLFPNIDIRVSTSPEVKRLLCSSGLIVRGLETHGSKRQIIMCQYRQAFGTAETRNPGLEMDGNIGLQGGCV